MTITTEKELVELLKDEIKVKNIKELDLSHTEIKELPKEIGQLTSLEKLDLSIARDITELPKEIGQLTSLEKLDLRMTKITELPIEIGQLTSLKELDLTTTKITELPKEIGQLINLETLKLNMTQITELPKEIGELKNLKELYLGSTKITEIPKEVLDLKNLIKLDLNDTKITEIPVEIKELKNLTELYLVWSGIKNLPKEIGELKNLVKLDLKGTKITEIPKEIGELKNLNYLSLGSKVKELPIEIFELPNLDTKEFKKLKLKPKNQTEDKNTKKTYYITYDEYRSGEVFLVKELEEDKNIFELNEIVIGCWESLHEGGGSEQGIIDFFVENGEKFKNLKKLFVGDIDSEECEISWIEQMDYSKLWESLPTLEEITIKGSNSLVLGSFNHNNLKKFTIISGGLPVNVLEEIQNANLPKLEELTLYFGSEDYGYDISEEKLFDFINSLEERKNLKKLALVNSEVQDLIVQKVLESNFVKNLISLDFSFGILTDNGGNIITKKLQELSNLKELIIDYHFMSEEIQSLLTTKCNELNIELILSEAEDDEDYKFVMISE